MNPANILGLDYKKEAAKLPWKKDIIDAHVHLTSVENAKKFFEIAELFYVKRVWSQTSLEEVDALNEAFPGKIEFVATPSYSGHETTESFFTDWKKRLDAYAKKGVRLAKFWAGPRGLDRGEIFRLDHPQRIEVMRHAKNLGMKLMVHVADPDTWFATKYADSTKYGTKAEHHARLVRVLEEFADTKFLAAHMAGDPENLTHLQTLLDTHKNLYIDTSATKWMVRELSKKPVELKTFLQKNAGRVMFGSDIVVSKKDDAATIFDLYASRWWALRTMFETTYEGKSPIVDPDLHMIDATLPEDSSPMLRGASIDEATLKSLYQTTAEKFWE